MRQGRATSHRHNSKLYNEMRSLIKLIRFSVGFSLMIETGSFNLHPFLQRGPGKSTTTATAEDVNANCVAVGQEETQVSRVPTKGLAALLMSFLSVNMPLPSNTIVHAVTETGITSIDGEARRVFMKGKQNEVDGSIKEAQQMYEEVVQTEPDFIYGWSSLGNVLTADGNLDQALLCYKKAISLKPPNEELANLLLNKASIELATNRADDALNDLSRAENIGGKSINQIRTVRAVALSNEGRWDEASTIFEQVVQTSGKNALPWWLRYSMSLLETNRGVEAIGYLQRTMSSFPQEAECKAFAAALYTSQGSPMEGAKYWNKLRLEDKRTYSNIQFVKTKLKWGPIATNGLDNFINSKFSSAKLDSAERKLFMDSSSKLENGL